MAARKHESERTVPGYVSPKESPKAQRKKANTRDANDRKNALVAKLRSSVPGSPLLVRKPTGIPPFIALTNQRLPTIIDALQTPPLARPQSYVDSFAMTMTVIPQTMTTSTEAASRALAAGAITVADAVKNSLPFDVELFKDLANMLMTVLTRNAHEMPPLDIGELLLCLGMYCHYQIQKRLDEEDTVELQEILRETPRVTDREPYERFLYCIDFAEAAYYPNVEGILKICRQLQSSWIIDAKHESDEDCPAFFLATDHQNWTIVIAIRGTASLHDAIVDLKMDCEPFLHGYAHQGMAHLARKLLDRILPHMHLLRLKHPNYRTIVTGHSLGAGIASLLTLLLTSPPYATYFHDVRGVCYATPACCTEELTDRAAKVVDSLVLGYDVVPALSEKTLIWLLRELQRFSKENQHRKLLSETWNKQMEAMYENLSSNPRTGFLISAWESEAMSTVRNSIAM
ncbi:Alpha/Beta hydrolase protein [Gaertneriomyces semiglobifer]|nr:Alpha/Beta hydrolase protein [Gaertneriomyces semiglobifer]